MSSRKAPVTLCIINHNGAHYLEGALRAAKALDFRFSEILLIDNASTDGSATFVRECHPDVKLLVLPQNNGPGAARNAGIAAAHNDLILFQDNDVQLGRGCPERLLAVLTEKPAASIAVPRVLYERDPQTIQYEGADCHFLGLMMPRHADRPLCTVSPSIEQATSLITACFMINRARCSGMDYFDEDFFFNLEDHDFGVRSRLLGHEIWVDSAAFVHHGGGSAGLSYRPGYALSSLRMLLLIRNRWIVMAQSYHVRTLLLLLPLLLFYEFAIFLGAVKKGYVREWWTAVQQFIRHWPTVRDKRARIQSTRRIADRHTVKNGPLPLTAAMRSSPSERIALAIVEGVANGYWKCVRPFIN